MRWPVPDRYAWRRRFAYLPVRIGDTLIWWEYYETRKDTLWGQVRWVRHPDLGTFVVE